MSNLLDELARSAFRQYIEPQCGSCQNNVNMSLDQDDLIAVGLAVALRRKKRSKWTKDWLLKRDKFSHTNLLVDLKLEPDDWRNYLRMDEDTYIDLLCRVSPFITYEDTNIRKTITPHERLSVTLRYLATGRSLDNLKYSAMISGYFIGIIF